MSAPQQIVLSYRDDAQYGMAYPSMTQQGWVQVNLTRNADGSLAVTWQRILAPQFQAQPQAVPKKRGMPAIAIIGIVVVVLFLFIIVVGAIGGSGTKTATATAGNVSGQPIATTRPLLPTATSLPSVGQTVSLKNWDVTVVGVEKAGQMLQTSKSGDKKAAIGQWLVIAVTLTNTGRENFGFNDFDFVLKDANGVSIKVKDDFGFEGEYNSYRGGLSYNTQIPPGTPVHAFIAFDVGPNLSGMRLEFQGNKQLINLGL